jgi:hypothetical protein
MVLRSWSFRDSEEIPLKHDVRASDEIDTFLAQNAVTQSLPRRGRHASDEFGGQATGMR